MNFNHLAVEAQIVGAGLGFDRGATGAHGRLLAYVLALDDAAASAVQLSQRRITLSTQWRGMVALDAHRAVIQMSSEDAALVARMASESNAGTQAITDVQQQVQSLVNSPEGKAQFERIGQARARALEVIQQASSLRSQGQGAAAQQLVGQQLQAVVDAYIGELDAFVQFQHQRRDQALQQAQQARQSALWVGVVIALLVVAFGLWLFWLLVRSITQPLTRAVGLADAIAAGDLTQDVHDERGDELGQLLRALSAMGAKLRQVVGEVRAGVASVSSAAHEIASGNHDLSARTEQTAANLEETAASMEELTATVTQSADTARQANQLSANAAQATAHGGEVVGQVVASKPASMKSAPSKPTQLAPPAGKAAAGSEDDWESF